MVSTFGNEIETATPAAEAARGLSVVIPVLDEEARIVPLLRALGSAGVDETIVVDGGSRDASLERAGAVADRVLTVAGGLARQLNRGAELATRPTLLFLHADSTLPAGAPAAIAHALDDPATVGGAFRLRLDAPHLAARCIAWGANLRTSLGLGPFGDQGIFVRSEAFRAVGGFLEEVLLEDLDLVRRLRRTGAVRILPAAITTSARRWQEHGWVTTTLRNGWIVARHLTGGARSARARRSYARWRRGGRPSIP